MIVLYPRVKLLRPILSPSLAFLRLPKLILKLFELSLQGVLGSRNQGELSSGVINFALKRIGLGSLSIKLYVERNLLCFQGVSGSHQLQTTK